METLGLDFGTSGARGLVLGPDGVVWQGRTDYPTPNGWREALETLLVQIPVAVRRRLHGIAVDATTPTVLLADAEGNPLGPVLRYDDDRAVAQVEALRPEVPPGHSILAPTFSLAKLLWLSTQPGFAQARYFLHQADWLGGLLHGQWGVSDEHNALKLGYDVVARRYPDWPSLQRFAGLLPRVLIPGTPVAPITTAWQRTLGFPADCWVCAGTTDSIAAFLAAGAGTPGQAVTSLGSTLVLKLLSTTRVEAVEYGVYSHRLGDLWLVGGGSNSGGAVLKQFFSAEELVRLSPLIPWDQPTLLDYYPLAKVGERFPIADPTLAPRLTPRPQDPVQFLHGLLDGLARIEAQGYTLLQALGATPLTQVFTAGGGSQNPAWTALRAKYLGVPVLPAQEPEACYGAALLARWQR